MDYNHDPMSVPPLDEIQSTFAFLDAWEDRFQYVIDLGKRLPVLPGHEKCEPNRVHGCQSSVWLVMEPGENGALSIRATSDAFIVSGLIAILLAFYAGKTKAEILAADAPGFFKELGLAEHLSPTRRNGLFAMIERVRALAGAVQ